MGRGKGEGSDAPSRRIGREREERERKKEVVERESGRKGCRVAGTLDSSPHRHADLNGGLAPGARH